MRLFRLLVHVLLFCEARVLATKFRNLNDWKDEWKALLSPQESQVSSLSGFYFAEALYSSGAPILSFFLKTFINLTWEGVAFDSSAGTGTLKFRFFFVPSEQGTYSYSMISTHDGLPCFRLDLSNRFYEGRFTANGDLLNIVTFTDGSFADSGGISDVHKLSTKFQLI